MLDLPPPSKIIGIATNYRRHGEEMGRSMPAAPRIFLKPTTALCGPGDPIRIPAGVGRVDHEAELGVVIGEECSAVPIQAALDVVAGYTCINDVTARAFQKVDGIFGRAKGFDTFCPMGPAVVPGLDPSDLRVACRVNGATRQDGRTSDLIFPVPVLIHFVSSIMTLLPGDVIATGTPMGVGPLEPGDVVEIEVEGVGVLSNPVVAGRAAWTP
jgi:2-keto-4-pentenoate hydratase/2-oxohepta-3-ene-1,7-dioic acid hydratase in catechol pathway